ncbi:hypothetical protein HELRODRAFT_176876 [Helobdella robusta]|uniref:Uncharacterized protein n=1 Tax=Helobdella robusta TaxID=6412 RepID=T1FAZ9_HELRO|nr:hypothetical protein HELRODRAFT_176876 [Helobdella robusta]ESN98409.1 hypothetical protein HELRODRAFT_176876 [Helobdella robusta]
MCAPATRLCPRRGKDIWGRKREEPQKREENAGDKRTDTTGGPGDADKSDNQKSEPIREMHGKKYEELSKEIQAEIAVLEEEKQLIDRRIETLWMRQENKRMHSAANTDQGRRVKFLQKMAAETEHIEYPDEDDSKDHWKQKLNRLLSKSKSGKKSDNEASNEDGDGKSGENKDNAKEGDKSGGDGKDKSGKGDDGKKDKGGKGGDDKSRKGGGKKGGGKYGRRRGRGRGRGRGRIYGGKKSKFEQDIS